MRSRRRSVHARRLFAARMQAEDALANVITRVLRRTWREVYPAARRLDRQRPKAVKLRRAVMRKALETVVGTAIWDRFKARLHAALWAAIENGTVSIAQVENLSQHGDETPSPFADFIDPAYLPASVSSPFGAHVTITSEDIAASYAGEIGKHIDKITEKTRSDVAGAVSEWYNGDGETLGGLVDRLSPLFNERRARTIAATETTWLASAVTREQMLRLGVTEWTWSTRKDEIVCRVCRDKNGKTFGINDPMPPEASHPNCRCSARPKMDSIAAQTGSTIKPALDAIASVGAAVSAHASGPKINVKQYVAIKQKHASGGVLTPDEIRAAAVYSEKTWHKPQAWISEAKVKLVAQSAPVAPLTVATYVDLSQKAIKQLLTPPELAAVEAFSIKTWGKPPAWVQAQKDGKLKPATVPVKKKAKSTPLPVPIAPKKWQPNQVIPKHALTAVNLHEVEPGWQAGQQLGWHDRRYGAVFVNENGEVLLREPRDHFGGYAWTFPKGRLDYEDEHPLVAAEREVAEETGYHGHVVGIVPGAYGGTGSSKTFFFLMRVDSHNPDEMDSETINTRWVKPEEAKELISQTSAGAGRTRDMAVLQAALETDRQVREGKVDYSHILDAAKPAPPPVPEKPKKKTKPVPQLDLFAPRVGFPEQAEGLKVIQHLGGSTGAQLVEDTSGARFVLKRGNSPAHVLEEAATDAAYQAAGVRVPEFRLYQTPTGPVKMSRYIPGAVPYASAPPELQARAAVNLRKHFAVDVLLGNWDVLGQNADNVLVEPDGTTWRVDNGGGLRTRAQGAPKASDWNEHPIELWTMRDATIWDDLVFNRDQGYHDIMTQVRDVQEHRDAIMAAVPADVRDVLGKRLDSLVHLADASDQMQAHGWADRYQDAFGRQIVELGRAGVSQRAPTRLTARRDGRRWDVRMRDETGKAFDSMRGHNSLASAIQQYINANGGDYDIISEWADGQAGSSWNGMPQALKWHFAQQAGNPDDYWWKSGKSAAHVHYKSVIERYGKEKFERTIQMYHAFTYEYLSRMDLPHKNADGTIFLVRTENQHFIDLIDAHVGQKDISAVRGALESTSLLNPITYLGDQVTSQNVPLSNVFGTYLVSRESGSDHGAFAADSENEFVVILGRQKFNYLGSIGNYDYK